MLSSLRWMLFIYLLLFLFLFFFFFFVVLFLKMAQSLFFHINKNQTYTLNYQKEEETFGERIQLGFSISQVFVVCVNDIS